MNSRIEIECIQKEFDEVCKRCDQLRHQSIQGNLSTKMAYEQCAPSLEIKRHNTKQYLTKLIENGPKLDEYYLQNAKKSLQEFVEGIRNAESKIHNARIIPPFLY